MSFYVASLFALVLANAFVAYHIYKPRALYPAWTPHLHRDRQERSKEDAEPVRSVGPLTEKHEASDIEAIKSPQTVSLLSADDGEDEGQILNPGNSSRFQRQFLVVYALACAADWLQGSYIYTLYKTNHHLSESTVAALFTTGFFAGAVSATFVGSLADRYGRKNACLAYCLIYSLSCLTVLSEDLNTLFAGRILGGVSTTLLFSVFEAWMVSECQRRNLDKQDGYLTKMFSTMSVLNGIVAVLSGIVSQMLAGTFGSVRAPFMGSILCLMSAAALIRRYWQENYGVEAAATTHDLASTWIADTRAVIQDVKLLTLILITCIFEGSMYLFVYFWTQALTTAQDPTGPRFAEAEDSLPFGIIFANFMCAMMLGSFLSRIIARSAPGAEVATSSSTLQTTLCIASSALDISISSERRITRFLAFCIFEVCVGLYFPSMALMKGALIDDARRGHVYGLMRLPLNSFVVGALSTISDGDIPRENRFGLCGLLLLSGAIMLRRFIT